MGRDTGNSLPPVMMATLVSAASVIVLLYIQQIYSVGYWKQDFPQIPEWKDGEESFFKIVYRHSCPERTSSRSSPTPHTTTGCSSERNHQATIC